MDLWVPKPGFWCPAVGCVTSGCLRRKGTGAEPPLIGQAGISGLAGTNSVGESRTPGSPSGVWPTYTGGADTACGEMAAAAARSGEEGAMTRDGPGPRKKRSLHAQEAQKEAISQAERAAIDRLPAATKLKTIGEQGLELIKMVRAKSGNLKGTFTKALREANAEDPVQHDDSVITVANLRVIFEELSRSIMERTSNMINARIEGMQDRLLPAKRLRPPLAADGKSKEKDTHPTKDWPAIPQAGPSRTVASTPAATSAPASEKKAKKKKRAGKEKPADQQPAPPAAAVPGPSEGWNTVVRRKGKKKALPNVTNTNPTYSDATRARPKETEKISQKPKPKKRTRRRRPTAPATAAVVITLQHDAVERGATYSDVIMKARQEINLAELGLTEGVRVRRAATGAQIMELPPSATSETADRLADKMRLVLAGVARVARPVKCTDIRVSGLDDSVTREAVLAAVGTKTGCSLEHIKGGDVRQGPGGTGTMWVRCPVAAANTLMAAGRLLVGWSSARVQAMEPKAMKCFRCLEIGHTGRQCTSEVDRSGLCFRCGQDGHKSSSCTAKPHCAIYCSDTGPPLVVRERGRRFVAADRGEYTIFGVYFSPNKTLGEFEAFLDELLAAVLRAAPRPALVAGDFNAKNQAWGSPVTNARGDAVLEWSVQAGLSLLNRGAAPTCVRPQGSSIVDLSFASPAVGRLVQNWRVEEEVETLSDHLYIRFCVSSPNHTRMVPRSLESASEFPRWSLTKLDPEALSEAIEVEAWTPRPTLPANVNAEALWFREDMTRICDAAMPRVRGPPARKQVYWWTDTIAELRHQCIRARRPYQRQRRRRTRNESLERRLRSEYSAAKSALHLAIKQAKEAAREEMLAELDRDPWGRPYRIVRNKIGRGPPALETLPPEQLPTILSALFPTVTGADSPTNNETAPLGEIPPVSEGELDAAILRLRGKKTAPGPDGIPGRVWVKALGPLKERLRELFSACLTQSEFPQPWKEGKLVLLRKDGRPADSPSAYRPIVLLDEAGKLLERVIASRIIKHLEQEGPNLSAAQFGFRAQRSTIDAIMEVKEFCEERTANGAVVLAVSFDIANAFNTLPFESAVPSAG
ncbi:uncharacterized protein LOC121731220 [Aricia agestis]|uniref:uncharacterized protein LOC121731220 n=1 Tax=Aricia agestis TaxID=91739 RepID=UPI001C209835|nr:uncharacterized protein LOC121731220 [Aricia agestis]